MAMFPATCSACGTRPAEFIKIGDGRCSTCAPDGCQICWVWTRRCCKTHQAPAPLVGPEQLPVPANGNAAPRRDPKIYLHAGVHPALTDFVATRAVGGAVDRYLAARTELEAYFEGPRCGSEDPTAVELPVVPEKVEALITLVRREPDGHRFRIEADGTWCEVTIDEHGYILRSHGGSVEMPPWPELFGREGWRRCATDRCMGLLRSLLEGASVAVTSYDAAEVA